MLLGTAPATPRPASKSAPAGTIPLLYTVAPIYAPMAWVHGEDRFPGGSQIFFDTGAERHVLFPEFFATADPAVSFDGKSILFAGRRSRTNPWQIWESPVDYPEAHRILDVAEDCIRPLYLPGDRVVYARKKHGRYVIETVSLQAPSSILQLTYSEASALPNDVLRDGRILFSSVYPAAKPFPELYTVYSDGSGVEAYRCDHLHAHSLGRQVSSGDIVFARERGLGRFTSALAQEVPVTAPSGEYAGDVAEEKSDTWLFSRRASANDFFALERWTPGSSSPRTLVHLPRQHVTQPAFVVSREVPARHPSGLHDWPNANLLCLNVYTSPYKFAAGAVRAVRVETQDSSGSAISLGEAPVEADGSFFVQIPADSPVRIELLDAEGRSLKSQRAWFWMRRGEQRVCVGCHSGPQTAPENAVPAVLLRSTTPASLTGALSVHGGN